MWQLAKQRPEIVDKGAVHIIGQNHEVGPFGCHQFYQFGDDLFTKRDPGRVAGIYNEERLDPGIFQLLELRIRELESVLLWGLNVDDVQIEIFKMRQLNIRSKDGCTEGDGVSRAQKAIGFERFKEIAHRSRSTFNSEQIKFAGRARFTAHGPHEVFVNYTLVVDQHAIRNWIIVANDGIDQFVDECVRVEPELLHCKRRHGRQKGRAGHIAVLTEPGLETAGDAVGLWHSANTCRMFHHTLTFGNRELTQQKKPLPRSSGDPVGIAPSGIEEGRLRCP